MVKVISQQSTDATGAEVISFSIESVDDGSTKSSSRDLSIEDRAASGELEGKKRRPDPLTKAWTYDGRGRQKLI